MIFAKVIIILMENNVDNCNDDDDTSNVNDNRM